jgi:hypothetical protein
MKLEHCILACNENTKYLYYWHLVKRAWNNLIGIPVTMVYIGESLPIHLLEEPNVKLFKPVDNMPTATQAQMIRLLYPAIVDCSGAVVLGDMDCMPLNKDFFHRGFLKATDDQFVSLKAPLELNKEIVMCYVGASPTTWSALMNVKTIEDIRERMNEWAEMYPANGKHGGLGWTSDQLELYKRVKMWEVTCPEKLSISSWAWDYPRLDRGMPNEWLETNQYLESRLAYRHYIDFHMPSVEDYFQQIQHVLYISEHTIGVTPNS